MSSLLELLPWLTAMAILIGLSAFFSASEAALFYLRPGDRRKLEQGNARERAAFRLLQEPDRLLSGVLFWNLVVNITYFALSSVVVLQIEQNPDSSSVASVGFAVGSLVMIIFFSEMMPKSLAVIRPAWIATLVSLPLEIAIRFLDPIMPLLRGLTRVSRRLIWPSFQPEPYMSLSDLERAIHISSEGQSIIGQEQTVLNNIVKLSEIRIDEWMRPRTQFQVFRPPVSLADLQGTVTPSGYMLVAESDSEEIERAFHLDSLTQLKTQSIDTLAQPVLYLPWNATVADALEKMSVEHCRVTSVVNEFGETVGILTMEDILETVFSVEPSRSKRLLDLDPISHVADNLWTVSGMMSLKQLGGHFALAEFPETRSVTVAGVIQEQMQRMVEVDDECEWGPFRFRVAEMQQAGNVVIELSFLDPANINGPLASSDEIDPETDAIEGRR